MRVGVNARLLLHGELEGIGRFTFETLCEMARSHPEVYFILFFDRPFDKKYLPYPNMKGVTIYLPTRLPILLWIWLEILVPFFLWIYSIDVFFAPDNFLSLRSNVPTLLVCHDIVYFHSPESINKRWISYYQKNMPRYLAKATKVASVSQFVKDDLISSLGVDQQKIEVVYNALPNRIISELRAEFHFDFDYFIYIGSIHPRKNIGNLIDGFKLFDKTNHGKIKLILVGRMAWDSNEIVDKLAKSDEILHLNNVTDDQVYHLVKNSLGLVYISNFEGFGIPILEGFHSEVPVITSNVTSMPEVAGNAAFLVDPTILEEISNAFRVISTDKVLSSHLVNAGRKRLKDFSWSRSADQLFKSLKDISKT